MFYIHTGVYSRVLFDLSRKATPESNILLNFAPRKAQPSIPDEDPIITTSDTSLSHASYLSKSLWLLKRISNRPVNFRV